MTFLIILAAVLLCFVVVVMYFFSVAFVKHNVENTDDLDAKVNKPLEKYKARIKSGMDYIDKKPSKRVNVISHDGLKLSARYFDNHSDKTVLLFHGYRSSAARDFSCAVEMYSKMGFNILLCDQRSHGRSEGKLITFGVKESRDVLSWVEFVTAQYSPEKIVLGGMSMGATTVLLSLSQQLPDTVKAVVADCGFTSPVDIIKMVAKKSFRINASFFIPFLNLACLIIGHFSITKANTVDSVKQSNIPVLLIHGENDGFVPCEMSKQTYEGSDGKAQLLLVKGADHGLSFLVDEQQVLSGIEEFLKKHI